MGNEYVLSNRVNSLAKGYSVLKKSRCGKQQLHIVIRIHFEQQREPKYRYLRTRL